MLSLLFALQLSQWHLLFLKTWQRKEDKHNRQCCCMRITRGGGGSRASDEPPPPPRAEKGPRKSTTFFFSFFFGQDDRLRGLVTLNGHCGVIFQPIFKIKVPLERSFPNLDEHFFVFWIERKTAERQLFEIYRRIDFAIDRRLRLLPSLGLHNGRQWIRKLMG